jgi:hypothetical protein
MLRHTSLALAVLLALAWGCTPDGGPPDGGDTPYVDRIPQTRIFGFAYDPEAFFISLATCPAACPAPALSADVTHYRRAAINDATLVLQNPADPSATLPATGKTKTLGYWDVTVSNPDPASLLLPVTSGGALAEPANPPLPTATYVSTVTVRRLSPDYGHCYFQEAAALSNNGILSAIAKFLASEGPATSVSDLSNPARYAGVVVFWLYKPAPIPVPRAPAFNTTVRPSTGRVLHLAWSPPGAAPTPEERAIQSDRGFYVAKAATTSPIGATAVVFAANGNKPVSATVTPFDPSDESELLRQPYVADAVSVQLRSAQLAFSPVLVRDNPKFADPPQELPLWLCYPD